MKVQIVKIGGNVIDEQEQLSCFLDAVASLQTHTILIHGGGKIATEISKQLGIEAQMIEGRRITDAPTLRVVTMVYAGLINKQIVASLQQRGVNAIGLCGADGNIIRSHKRQHPSIDYGFVGDVDEVNASAVQSLLEQGLTPVIAPITHDGKGQLLNTNADTIAAELAMALAVVAEVELCYCFEKAGVLLNVEDEGSLIEQLTPAHYQELRTKGAIAKGMIPKLDNAFRAAERGVQDVRIMHYTSLLEHSGTRISN